MMLSCSFNSKRIRAALLAVFFLMPAASAQAHRVNVFAWVEGDTVHTESRFPGGKEVKEGQIAVFDDATGEKLLEGQTDEEGNFSFPVPRRADLRIELTAGMGHKNEWIVRSDEMAAAGGVAPAPAAPGDKNAEPAKSKTAAAGVETVVDPAQIQAAVEKVLDRKLAPVVKGMAELRERRTGVADIVGGIGYIIGLAGLGAYIHYRRKIKELEQR
jgi:nickel transport protein